MTFWSVFAYSTLNLILLKMLTVLFATQSELQKVKSMKAEDALVGGLLSFPENYQVIEIKGEAKNVEEGLLEIAPDEIGKWQISKSDSALVALVTFKDVDLIISGIKKNILGWVIEFDGKLEKYETAEQMRDRVFELLK